MAGIKWAFAATIAVAGTAGCAPVDYCDPESSVAKDSVLIVTQSTVRSRLRAPASAQFPTMHNKPGVSVVSTGECRWSVRAYVDSQNSFGAMLRTRYHLTARANPDGSYAVTDIYFDE